MNSKLAKKLKIAGCPSRKHTQDLIVDQRDGWIAPTLSELIEACGDRFHFLVKWRDPVLGVKWSAYPLVNDRLDGDTPEEAVANLYLSLKSHE